jgi:hypothetical protein
MELLQEAVQADEGLGGGPGGGGPLDPSSLALLEELRERQAMVASGELDLERSFDDFRVVVGENGL